MPPPSLAPLPLLVAAGATLAAIGFWRRALEAEAEAKELSDVMRDSAATLPAMPLLPISSKETIQMCKDMILRDDDVFVCSYPKSGTTWMQHIVCTLLTRGAHPKQGEHISNFSPFFEIDQHWEAAAREPKAGPLGTSPSGRRVFNTHLRWAQMPRSDASGAKYIYVVRDGRDVCTSFFHHLSNQAGSGGFEGSFDEFFEGWLRGMLPYGRWVDHVKSWLLRSGEASRDSVLEVYYEDLKLDLGRELRRINEFLGLDDLGDGEHYERLIAMVSFKYMKDNEDLFQPISVTWKPGYHFIRKGETGDHGALLNKEQICRFNSSLQADFPTRIFSIKKSYFH